MDLSELEALIIQGESNNKLTQAGSGLLRLRLAMTKWKHGFGFSKK